jgi:hypothetical protein
MNQAALEQLLSCRRLRQDRTIEMLAARLNGERQAEDQAEAARIAAADHEAMRRDREAELLDSLQGRKLSLVELDRYKARLGELAAEADRLRSQVAAAEAEAKRWDGLVAEARSILRRHRREHEKWQELTLTSARDEARRQDVLSEIETESGLSDRAGALRVSNGVF